MALGRSVQKYIDEPRPIPRICITCNHLTNYGFTCKHNGESVEYEGEENEDCSLYVVRKRHCNHLY